MPTPLLVLLVLCVLALLAWLHLAFWSWRFRVPAREDALLRAPTKDGWRLAVGRNLPRGSARRPPVLLVHGIAMNRQAFELGVDGYSLAAFLAEAGFDCFSLDLRGHGASRRPRGAARGWNLDTYLAEDLPAALDAIRRETGAERVLYVGHSQGAVLGLAACGLYPERIAALAALAAPVQFDVQDRLRALVRYRFLPLGGRFLRPFVRSVAPFSGVWHPRFADLAVNARNVAPPVYRRALANAIENLYPGVLAQFEAFIREDAFRSMDGAHDYRAALATCAQPALFVAAERDGLAPPAAVEGAYARWGGPKALRVFEDDFGHLDLLYGRRAPELVYPVVRDFLIAHSAEALP